MCRSQARRGRVTAHSSAVAGYTLGNSLALFCFAILFSTVHSGGRISKRQADQQDKCTSFTRGNGEFYSPGWPGEYPVDIDCVRIISAPVGQYIEIDFRDTFDVETSPQCKEDFLLIRDGKDTYSDPLARLCGKQFPSRIRSSGNHLWLQFRSDESGQYMGFRVVYTFRENKSFIHTPECRFDVTGPEAIISTKNISQDLIARAIEEDISLDCSWRVTVPEDREIQISFKEFNLDKPNECALNFVEILYGVELRLIPSQNYCSSKADSVKLPKGEDVTFRYFAAPSTLKGLQEDAQRPTSVVAVATELRERNGKCGDDEFDCDDLYCISAELVCNGNFNCDKQLDEKNCGVDEDNGSRQLFTSANITVMVIGAALLFGLCFSVCWNCIRKLRDDFREKEEIVRQSREDDLDTLPETMPRVRPRVTLDDGGCYVPGMELKLLPEHRNGGARLVREDLVDLDVDTADCGCQTGAGKRRDSRDSCASGSSTPPPPPPPCRPPSSAYRGRQREPHPGYDVAPRRETRPQPRARLRDQEDDEEDDERSGMATPRSYRSEAVIEMSRPGSRHSSRSAPDVVIKL